MKHTVRFGLLLVSVLVASLGIIGCNSQTTQTPETTLVQVDDYPLYVMHLYEDYHFDEYLETGRFPGVSLPSNSQINDAIKACSCFSAFDLPGQAIFGRNYDWRSGFPVLLLFTYPSNGYASVSMMDMSLLGSGSDQHKFLGAPYIPVDGMNECGLAVALMAVDKAQPPNDPNKVDVNVLTAIRLMLDKAQSVDEALSLLGEYNIPSIMQHYLIADASGNSAVVEFVDGEMKVICNKHPWQVSTNFVLSRFPESERRAQCPRYDTAYKTLEQTQGRMSHEEAMTLLKNLSGRTIWSLVYDMVNGEIDIVMARNYDQVHYFTLSMRNE
ncbi:MAG TPA: linear amide C-N hydrolase [Dehalococcoidia bacterium]|nr:linear amide C-N hydrolase [Dehalococcoidia bacterium]